MIMGISRVYMIIYGILVYHMLRHTHIFHAKVLSKEFHWQNATLHIASTATWWMQASCPCGMRVVYPLVVVRDPALQYIHVLKKKGLQWLLHVPTKRNLKVVAATMIHCAKFAELLTSHPVPLSPSSTVNWSRGECHVNMRSKVNYYKNSSLLWRFVANTLFAITTELHSAFLRQAQHAFYAVCIQVSNFLKRWVAVHPKRRHQGISLDWR